MQLIYRGNIFDYSPSSSNGSNASIPKASRATARNTIQQPVKLIYRGSTYSVVSDSKLASSKPKNAMTDRLPYTLIYRGSTYVVNGSH